MRLQPYSMDLYSHFMTTLDYTQIHGGCSIRKYGSSKCTGINTVFLPRVELKYMFKSDYCQLLAAIVDMFSIIIQQNEI